MRSDEEMTGELAAYSTRPEKKFRSTVNAADPRFFEVPREFPE
jgi:hypothetical protein